MLFNARLYMKLNHAEQLVIESLEMKKFGSSSNIPTNNSPDGQGFNKDMQNLKNIISSSLGVLKNVHLKTIAIV